jgi:quercetin dioxygenase-like cupin family protein
VQVIDGGAEIKIDGQSHFLRAGDIIIMPANIPHALRAVTKFKMLLTMLKAV